jgi:hypothetical protein
MNYANNMQIICKEYENDMHKHASYMQEYVWICNKYVIIMQ